MRKTLLFVTLLIQLFGYTTFSQNNEWNLRTDFYNDVGQMFYKQEGNIKYTFYSDVDISERNSIMDLTNLYIEENLAILKESGFNDSIDIILVRNRNDMVTHVGGSIGGVTYATTDEFIKQKMIVCIGGDKNPLKHELMHMVSQCKWGTNIAYDSNLFAWLQEGLATYADPEAECDNYSFEEKYVYFIQSKKIIGADLLITRMSDQHSKIAYNQSAYIVKLLIDNYGIDCLKKLWAGTMDDFITIYGLSFNDMMKKIETELIQKYPDPIAFDWDEFEKKCY